MLPDVAEKLQTCIRTLLATEGICTMLWLDILINLVSKSLSCTLQRESGIADDTKGIIGILIIQFFRLLIGTGQNHLRATTHTHGSRMTIQGLLGKVLTLLKYIIIKVWQDGTVEANRVFYQEYHLNTSLQDVMLQVHLILNQLDDGEDEVGVAQPAEDIIEDTQVFILHTLGNTMREWS